MNELKISTAEPKVLKASLVENIQLNTIRSWQYDEEQNFLSHKGAQYKNHFYFKVAIDDKKGLLIFTLHPGVSDFANSRAFQLLERMLRAHFEENIEIIKS